MADDSFFKGGQKETPKEEKKQPEKIKVGDNEYTQKELGALIDLGSKAKDWEDKGGSSFDELKTKFGKRGERIGQLKKFETKVKELEEAQKKAISEKPKDKLTEEELKIQVVEEAKKFGLITKSEVEEMFNSLYQQRRSGERILTSANRVLKQAKKDGRPVVEVEKLLEFMADPDNPKDPVKAYKLMFEKELDEWKEKQLMKTKKLGLFTEEKSTAGSKEPERESVTRDNIDEKLKAIFQSS